MKYSTFLSSLGRPRGDETSSHTAKRRTSTTPLFAPYHPPPALPSAVLWTMSHLRHSESALPARRLATSSAL